MAKKRSKKAAPKRHKVKAKARRKSPRSQVLPGMEQVRSVKLDRLCESISETREEMNRLRQQEKEDCRNALRTMHDNDTTAYRHAGVELVRIPGEEKLRVRTSKEDATDLTPEEPKEEAKPDGQVAEASEVPF